MLPSSALFTVDALQLTTNVIWAEVMAARKKVIWKDMTLFVFAN
jgi:hypothetical protein